MHDAQLTSARDEEIASGAASLSDSGADFSIKKVGGSTATLAVGVLIGQAFGILRTLFVANQIGVSSTFDAILVALVAPTILANWLSNAMRVAIVPAHESIATKSGGAAASRFVGGILTYLALFAVVVVGAVLIFAAPLIDVTGPGLAPATRDLAINTLPILAPMLALTAMANMMVAVCQIHKRFVPVSLTSALGGLAGLITTVVLWNSLGVSAYAYGTTMDAGFSLFVLLVATTRLGVLPHPTLRLDLEELRAFAKHVLPMTVGSAVLQLNLVSDRAIATLLASGAASALKYGQQLVTAPAAALSSSWATVLYPSVVAAGSPRARRSMGEAMNISLKYTVSIFVPIVVATVTFAPMVVDLIYGRGAFNTQAVWTTTSVIVAFAPMLLLSMVQPVFTAAHNARRRGTLMAVTGVTNALLNVVLNLAFGSWLGVAGIALSSSVTLTILLVFLAIRVPRSEGFRPKTFIGAGARALLASLMPALPIGILVWSIPFTVGPVVQIAVLVAGALLGAGIYVWASNALGLHEPALIAESVAKRVSRRVRQQPVKADVI